MTSVTRRLPQRLSYLIIAYLHISKKPLQEMPQNCIADNMPSVLTLIRATYECLYKSGETFNKTQLLLLVTTWLQQ